MASIIWVVGLPVYPGNTLAYMLQATMHDYAQISWWNKNPLKEDYFKVFASRLHDYSQTT